jgi:hypothetical protein
MSGGLRLRTALAGAAVLLSAAGAAVLGATGASAAPSAAAGAASNMSMSVSITSQGVAGSSCTWGVTFNVTITNSSKTSATVTSVDAGSYNPLVRNGGLAAGTVLKHGSNTFTGLFSSNGTSEGQPCPTEAPDPLVLTVNTSAGSLTWNQSVSDPQVVTMMALPQTASAILAGSFDVANCTQYYFEYGTTTNYGTKVGQASTGCPNDGTKTQIVGFTATGLTSGTTYHYRIVVVENSGGYGTTKLYGQDVQFTTTGGTQVPIGSIGLIGLTALAGGALFAGQRWRRRRRNA